MTAAMPAAESPVPVVFALYVSPPELRAHAGFSAAWVEGCGGNCRRADSLLAVALIHRVEDAVDALRDWLREVLDQIPSRV